MADNNESGVIDITNLVGSMKSTFVTWASGFVFAEIVAVPGLQWLSLPLINVICKALISTIINILALSTVMEAFFLNTSIRKSSQAQDYVDALTAKQNLPPTTSNGDYEKAEQAEIDAFNSFVVLSN